MSIIIDSISADIKTSFMYVEHEVICYLVIFLVSVFHGLLDPLTHRIVDLRISKDSLVLNQVMIYAYSSDCFIDNFSAKFFINIWHSYPIPPFVPITRGVNVPCCTSRIRWLYILFFHSLGFWRWHQWSDFCCWVHLRGLHVCQNKHLTLFSKKFWL